MMNQQNTQSQKDHLSRSFDWHNATQFLGALNDNVFRWLLVFFLIHLLGQEKADNITALAAQVFVVPFLLFTPYAGTLADRFSKRNIIVITKIGELAFMVLGLLMFYLESRFGMYTVLFLMCCQSAFFSPCKYGIIPELVRSDQLSRATSFVEGLTYLAIVLGTGVAVLLVKITGENYILAGIGPIFIAAGGAAASFRIHKTQPKQQEQQSSFIRDMTDTIKRTRHDRPLVLAIFAAAYFLLLGAFAQIVLIPYGMEVCGLSKENSGILFIVAAVGIGFGSWLAGKLSGRAIEFGIVPLGAAAMALASIGLGLISYNYILYLLIVLFGIGAGLFIVPIHAFIQFRSPQDIRGKVLALSGFLGWIGVLAAGLFVQVFSVYLGVDTRLLFLAFGLFTLALAVFTIWMLPDFLVRLIVVLITRSIYRIKVHGPENVPHEGPALLVSNHVSWADPVILLATQSRRIRFVMDRGVFSSKWFNWLFRLARVIPVSAGDSPKKIMAALEQARAAMDEGYLVCIFAEGTITRTGMLGRFRSGFEKIAKGTDYQIVPVYLGGVWGSILSHYHGRLFSAWPKKIPYPVSVHFGSPLPADISVEDLRMTIEELSGDYFDSKKTSRISMGQTFVQSARTHWPKPFVSDTTGKQLTWGQTLTAAVFLSRKLDAITAGQTNIGIFLPSSVAGTCANLAVALLGKVAANLSYKASDTDRQYMLQQAEIKTILTSRAFLEKIELAPDALPGAIFIEDLLENFSKSEKAKAWLKARFWPARILARARDFHADDTAVILFSSGSSGRPKGVLLSHHNILSNLEAALMVFRTCPDDKLCGVLPFFHSFGLTCTLWLPILAGVPVCFVPNPLDAKLVGETVKEEKATLLFATPTFLLNYYRRCEPEDFKTIRFMIAGAEKLKVKMIDAFEKKFGIRPREGYGATECAPLIAMNVPDVEVSGVRQAGTREGTAGHPLPGLAVRIVDPESGQKVPIGESGLLWVKGPNVMKGYLNLPEKTAQVLHGGWYNTGDIVTLDKDGFITIVDRLSRFSKIGGEMVPHMTIEETCAKLLGLSEPAVAVTSLPDEKKGEQLVLIYAKDKIDPEELYNKLAESDLPKLYIPKRDNVIGVDQIPVLGSGKLDLMRLRQLAEKNKQSDKSP